VASLEHKMKVACCIFILWLVILNPVLGFELTEQSRISILTIDPGQELYTIFGHSAIRVTDENLKIDRIYNFGTFDSSSPFFYIEFLKGDIKYFLSITDYETFFRTTASEKRKIVEQILDLTYPEKLLLFNKLEKQYQSDARFYRYDFFYDNCATRVRDAIFDTYLTKINYDTTQFCCKTFRELLKPYIARNYWIDLGINLALGMGADKGARSKDFMFLPDYIRLILNQSTLVGSEQTLLEKQFSKIRIFNFTYLSPWVFLVVLLFAFFRIKYRNLILKAFLVTFSIAGLILLLVTSISVNKALSGNLNIWWTLPSLALLLVQNERINYVFEVIYCTFLVLLIFTGWLMIRGFSFTFLPWLITMSILLLADIRAKRNIRLVSAPIS
jgi:hypothetical protein